MAVSVNATIANRWLDYIRGTAPTALTGSIFVQLHTGNPGTAGTTSVSSTTTRQSCTFGAASNASNTSTISLTNTPAWTSWAGTNGESVTYVSFWDASTAGNFLFSAVLGSAVTVNTGNTLTLSSASLAITSAS